MVAAPADTLVTIPDDEPTVATPGLLLVHTPPPITSVSVTVLGIQYTEVGPAGVGGVAETVTTFVAKQPVGNA